MATSAVDNNRQLIRDPSAWISNFIKIHSVKVDPFGMVFDGKVITHQRFYDTVELSYHQFCENFNNAMRLANLNMSYPVKAELLRTALRSIYDDMKIKRLDDINGALSYDPKIGDAILRKWLALVIGDHPSFQTYLSVIKHYLQCVKRKMLGLPVENHLFPILVGTQGDGKTKAIQKLTQAVKDFTLEFTVDQLSDPTIIGCYQDNYVVICDEMAKADKADVAMLKRIVTNDRMSGRPPFGRVVETLKQNCCFIGSSNETVDTIIKDKEMRRFFEIEVIARVEADYPLMDAIDSLAIWKCIDSEHENVYYTPMKAQIRTMQSSISTRDVIHEWAKTYDVVPRAGEVTAWAENITMFESYRQWMQECNFEWVGSQQSFGRKLKNELKLTSKEFGQKKRTAYKINKANTLGVQHVVDQELSLITVI